MKFLGKRPNSQILLEGLMYRENSSKNNARIKELLVEEQHHFCAYTEKRLQALDSAEVEHFDSSIKFADDYFNYYAVLRSANLYKEDEKYRGATFLTNRFFQDSAELLRRVQYKVGRGFEACDPKDQEADAFIKFLGLNHDKLYGDREKHIGRIKDILPYYSEGPDGVIGFFRKYPQELSYITALEAELQLDLSEFYR